MEPFYLPEQIAGEQILLQQHAPHEAEILFKAVDTNRERLGKFLPWVDSTQAVQDEKNYIENCLDKWDQQILFAYSLYRKSDLQFLGVGNVHSISWKDERCELGYWILREYEGQGYISDFVRTIEATCFKLGFFRIEIHCDAKNVRSAAIPLRNGYEKEGHLRSDTIVNGKRRGTLIFAKLRTDHG
jgi:ribosomal-protein-serine acetyltransferase